MLWRDDHESVSDATLLSDGYNLIYLVLASAPYARALLQDVVAKLELPPFATLCVDEATVAQQRSADSNLSAWLQSYQTWVGLCANVPRKLLVFHDVGRLGASDLKQVLQELIKLGQDRASVASQYVMFVHWNPRGEGYEQMRAAAMPAPPPLPSTTPDAHPLTLTLTPDAHPEPQAQPQPSHRAAKELAAAALADLLQQLQPALGEFNLDALMGRVTRVHVQPGPARLGLGLEVQPGPARRAALGIEAEAEAEAEADIPMGLPPLSASTTCADLDLAAFTSIAARLLDARLCAITLPVEPSPAPRPALSPSVGFVALIAVVAVALFLVARRVRAVPAARASGSDDPSLSSPAKAVGGNGNGSGSGSGSPPSSSSSPFAVASSASASTPPLASLSRAQLQALAKQRGVKANLSSAEIIRLISEKDKRD